MSVYTTITPDALSPWLARYNVGELVGLKGIAAGITNTNYFVTTTRGRFVLTVFEVLRLDELPFYLNLMHHLARHGVAVASPVADRNDAFASLLAGKPACLVHCLPGQDVSTPGAGQCTQVGQQMAAMLYRYECSVNGTPTVAGSLSAYPDAGKVSAWATDAMSWCISKGIISGIDGKLVPDGTATRAQCAAIVQRYASK